MPAINALVQVQNLQLTILKYDRWTLQQQPPEMFFKIGFLKVSKISQRNTCVGEITLLKNTPTQVFSCKICEIFKNPLCYRTPLVAASDPQCLIVSKIMSYFTLSEFEYIFLIWSIERAYIKIQSICEVELKVAVV